ncbi:hypothetical protein GCM10008955_06740 [Deinococcus malanensis]|uniref:DUF2259 domain-containing protein n=1 Tax=Deinococcus malanensis TaxID=1706855 RepID=A0ABQ2EL06_9DEIO|nr:hypothetical protein GCM10008955_06740 [Deinococcus malanensis]
MRWFLPLLALLVLSSAVAGNRLEVQRVAFNAAGTHVLVLTAGSLDGSGFSAAELQVLETRGGVTVLRARLRSEHAGVGQTIVSLTRQHRTTLQRLGLWPGRTSTPVYRRTFPVLAPVWSEGVGAGHSLTVQARLWSRPVPVELRTFMLPSRCRYQDMLPVAGRPSGMALRINGQLLYQDRALPEDRQCAASYALERLDVQGNRVVAVIRAYTPGFEGPNADAFVVAGQVR